MSKNIPVQASSVKKGGHAILKNRPCKITHVSISKTDKHGHAKMHFVGVDVFTGKKYEEICPSTHTIMQPVLERDEFDLLMIEDDGYLTLLEESGIEKNDIRLPENELGEKIREKYNNGDTLSLTVLRWGEEEAVISMKKIRD